MVKFNFFDKIPFNAREEIFEDVLNSSKFRIERIVSNGQSSPEGFWYDQNQNEFVVLLSGAAHLSVEGEDIPLELAPGDAVNFPAHKRHRIDWTPENETTIWLAIFY